MDVTRTTTVTGPGVPPEGALRGEERPLLQPALSLSSSCSSRPHTPSQEAQEALLFL